MKITAPFLDNTGTPIDYTTVKFSYSINRTGGAEQTLTYSPGGSGYGVIIKQSTGTYYVQLRTVSSGTELGGVWSTGWQGIDGSGDIQAQTYDNINVQFDDSGLF